MQAEVGLALVVPCYNEERRLDLGPFLEHLERESDLALFFVNDGSTDQTGSLLEAAAASLKPSLRSRFHVLHHPRNFKKAEAVRTGIRAALERLPSACEWIGFWDADLSTPLKELSLFRDVRLRRERPLFIGGCRIQRMGGDIQRRWYRHYIARVFATIATPVVGLPYYDTQCGAKLFHRSILPCLFEEPFVSTWLFDIELILRLKRSRFYEQNRACFYELPISQWKDKDGSKITSVEVLRCLWHLCKIEKKYKLGRF